MKTPSLFIVIVGILLTLPGCARIPQSNGYRFSTQHKMQAAHHWDLLAKDVARQVNDELIRQEFLETPVYIENICNKAEEEQACVDTPFAKGFNELLTTHLVNFGVPTLAEKDENALTIEQKVQMIYHKSGRISRFWPGVLTTLTSSIIALYDAPWQAQALVTSAFADAAGGARTINGHYEIIISTSIVHENRYLMHKSDIYYINDLDYRQYEPTIALPVADIELTSSTF